MCKDCGCSIVDHHHHDHGEGHHHHHHDHDHDHDHASRSHQAAHETLHHNPQLNDAKTISVISKILEKNDHEAAHNRAHFDAHGVLAINLMSSPGSGKTTLLEKMAEIAPFRFGVIEGDLETNRDADRIREKGIPAYQITTGSACHLDAFMVHKGLHEMPLRIWTSASSKTWATWSAPPATTSEPISTSSWSASPRGATRSRSIR